MAFPDEYYFAEGCFITEWLNQADDPQVSVARARLPAGGITRWHRLDGVTERYLILEGSGCAEVGQTARQLQAGDVLLIPPGQRQRIHNSGDSDLVFLAICTPRFTSACYHDLEPANTDVCE